MEHGAKRLGCLLLRWEEGAPAPRAGDVAVSLAPARDRVGEWLADGGELAVQALNPVAGLPLEERRTLRAMCAGPGSALAALCACAIGFARVGVALHPDDHEPFGLAATASGDSSLRTVVTRAEDLPRDKRAHFCFLGCGGARPVLANCSPLVKRLLPEGQLVLFGIPEKELRSAFEELSRHGFSLRGTGMRDGLGFLAGSLDHGHTLGG
jgi:hypothetical protein